MNEKTNKISADEAFAMGEREHEYCIACDSVHHPFSCPLTPFRPVRLTEKLLDKIIKEMEND